MKVYEVKYCKAYVGLTQNKLVPMFTVIKEHAVQFLYNI